MPTLDEQFNSLNEKLQALLRQLANLQRENGQLRESLQQAQAAESTAVAEVARLQQQASILKYAAGEMPERDKKAFEKTINQYVKQIDKCIAYLSE